MKSILMTTSAVLLVSGFALGQAQAACPEDIDAFNRDYEKTLQDAAAGEALSTSEQAQLFGLRTAAENMYEAGDADMCAKVIQRANLILDSAIAPRVIKPSELVGRDVKNAADENLGDIEDVMLDPVSGRIAYVVIEHGGFLGIGDDLFAVPWRAMKFVPGDDTSVILDIPEEKLENAPRFSRKDETPLERREWVTSVHNYYGVEPYWQDDVGTMAMQYGAGAGAGAGAAAQPASTSGTEPQTDVLVVAPVEGSASDSQTEPQPTDSAAAPAASSTETQPATDTQPAMPAQPSTDTGSSSGSQSSGAQSSGAQSSGTQSSGSQSSGTQPSSETQPATETQPVPETKSDAGTETQTQAASDSQSSAEPQSGGASLLAVQPAIGNSSSSGGDMDALVARIDQLEQDVEDLSQTDIGAEVKDSISSLEQKVDKLSEQMPGEEMKQSIDRLEKEVEQLSNNGVGDEIRQQIARLEEKVAALGDGGTSTGQASTNQDSGDQASTSQGSADQSSGGQGSQDTGGNQPAAVVIVPDQVTGGQQSGQTDQQSSGQQPADQQPADQQSSGQQSAGQQSAGQQSTGQQPADQQSSDQQSAGQQPAGQQPADQQPADQQSSGQQPAGQPGQQPSDSAAQQGDQQAPQEVVIQGTTEQATEPMAASSDTGAASGQPCEAQISQLEQDLERAEKQGVAVNNAQTELDDAQAMLKSSEALCRAAIKRAHDELIAVGFEPTQVN